MKTLTRVLATSGLFIVSLAALDLFTVTMTNSVESFNWTNLGEPTRYFRVIPSAQH